MIKAQIVREWQATTDPETGELSLAPLFPAMQAGDSWTDVTGQEPVEMPPNSVVLEATVCPATFAALEADTKILILWSEAVS